MSQHHPTTLIQPDSRLSGTDLGLTLSDLNTVVVAKATFRRLASHLSLRRIARRGDIELFISHNRYDHSPPPAARRRRSIVSRGGIQPLTLVDLSTPRRPPQSHLHPPPLTFFRPQDPNLISRRRLPSSPVTSLFVKIAIQIAFSVDSHIDTSLARRNGLSYDPPFDRTTGQSLHISRFTVLPRWRW